MTYGPPCPYRAVGYSWQAGLYPLSDNGLAIIAEHNGIPADKLPRGARCSSGPGMHRWMEALGALRAAGLPYRHASGRFLLPAEIAA
jgi:hypothetical protein